MVVGFSEGAGAERGQVCSLLLALMPWEGRYQITGRVGSGLVEEVRVLQFEKLSKRVLPSEFIEMDANLVAFRMVRPEVVVEITVGDLLYETEAGPKMNTLLEIDNGTYRIAGTVEGVKFLAPVFVRIRTDKKADAGDVRLTQIERFASPYAAAPTAVTPPAAELPKSKLLFRDVYRKTVGGKVMVQKFMVWKTNKEQSGDYPAYVLYVANLSTGRAEPLQRDVDISDSADQIRTMLLDKIAKNVKSGWVKVASLTDEQRNPPAPKSQKIPARKRKKSRGLRSVGQGFSLQTDIRQTDDRIGRCAYRPDEEELSLDEYVASFPQQVLFSFPKGCRQDYPPQHELLSNEQQEVRNDWLTACRADENADEHDGGQIDRAGNRSRS